MDLLQGLQSILGGAMSGGQAPRRNSGGGMGSMGAPSGMASGALSGLLNPAVLGGLASALLGGKSGGRSMGAMGAMGGMGGMEMGGAGMEGIGSLLGALMGGAGTMFDGHSESVAAANAQVPQYGTPASPDERATRLLRALIFAAKADGHIDANEQAAIDDQLQKLGVGPQGKALVRQAMEEPLDPNRVASGVNDGQEAIQIYALSCAITNADQFMERSYLDGLAAALRLPQNVKTTIESKLGKR